MKPLAILAGVLALVLASLSCSSGLPTQAAPSVANTAAPTVSAAQSVGTVYIRSADGAITGYLRPGESVNVYGRAGNWCWIDRANTLKVWCGCVSVGNRGCRKR